MNKKNELLKLSGMTYYLKYPLTVLGAVVVLSLAACSPAASSRQEAGSDRETGSGQMAGSDREADAASGEGEADEGGESGDAARDDSYIPPILYTKGSQLYYYSCEEGKSVVAELGSYCDSSSIINGKSSFDMRSSDSKWICSLSDYDGSTYTLYRFSSDAPADRTKVAEKMDFHSILDNGDIIYTSGKELFLYADGQSKSLFQEEGDVAYLLSEDQNKLFAFLKNPDTEIMDVKSYLIDIYKGESFFVFETRERYFSYDSCFENIYAFRDGVLYKTGSSGAEELLTGIGELYHFGLNSRTFFYYTRAEEPSVLYKHEEDGRETRISESFVRFLDSTEDTVLYLEENSGGQRVLTIKKDNELIGEYAQFGDIPSGGLNAQAFARSQYLYCYFEDSQALYRIPLEGEHRGEAQLLKDQLEDVLSMRHIKDQDSIIYAARVRGEDTFSVFLDGELLLAGIANRYGLSVHPDASVDYKVSGEGDIHEIHYFKDKEDKVIAANIAYGSYVYTKSGGYGYFITDLDTGANAGSFMQYANGALNRVDEGVSGFLSDFSSLGAQFYLKPFPASN